MKIAILNFLKHCQTLYIANTVSWYCACHNEVYHCIWTFFSYR